MRTNPIDGPYLVIVVAGEFPEAYGYAPLRAYAQPIYSGHRFVPVDTAFERQALRALLASQRELDRQGIDLAIEKPIFDRLTIAGPCRPDFLLQAISRTTGEVKQLAVEALSSRDPAYLLAKATSAARLERLSPVMSVSPVDVANGAVGRMLAAALAL